MKIMKIFVLIVFIVLCICGCLDEKKESKKLDTKDLICVRNSDYTDFKYEEKVTVGFDENAVITEYEEKYAVIYPTNKEAKSYYNETKLNNSDINITLDDNQVIFSNIIFVDENNNYFGKTKKQIKKIYIEELFYECK